MCYVFIVSLIKAIFQFLLINLFRMTMKQLYVDVNNSFFYKITVFSKIENLRRKALFVHF